MKAIPYIIICTVIISLSENIFLLLHRNYIAHNFLWVNLLTGICLVANIILFVLSKKHINKRQSDYIHKTFPKN